MKYPDGKLARLGDRVVLSNGEFARVVCSIDTNEYTEEFTKENWEYLESGVMIMTDQGALIHYQDPNTDFVKLDQSVHE